MKKSLSAIILIVALLIAVSALTACGVLPSENTEPNSSAYAELRAVYISYLQNGGVSSFDQWLATIKEGKAQGVDVASIAKADGDGRYTVTYTDGTTAVYSLKEGLLPAVIAQNLGINEIRKTGENTYCIYYEGGVTLPFTIAEGGDGILSVTKTSSVGGTDTYTITFADHTTTTFSVETPSTPTSDPTPEEPGSGDQPGGDQPGENPGETTTEQNENPTGGDQPGGGQTENDQPGETPEGSNDNPTGGDQPGTTEPGSGDQPGGDQPGENPGETTTEQNENPTGGDQPGGGQTGTDQPGETPEGTTTDQPGDSDQPGGDQPGENTEENPVPVPGAPALSVGANGISWQNVENATHYLVFVDGGTAQRVEGTTASFVQTEGDHFVSVRAMNGETEGGMASFSYRSAKTALSALSTDGLTASWTATALTVTLTVNDARAQYERKGDYYSYTCQGAELTFALSVRAMGGYDATNAVYYFGEDASATATISRTTLDAPTLSVNVSGITWDPVPNADSYLVCTDDGTPVPITARSVALLSTAGRHTVKVKAVSSDPMYADGEYSTHTYTTASLALSSLSTSGRTATWTATAISLTFTVNGAATTPNYDAGTYSYTCPAEAGTYDLSVNAVGGYDAESDIYYCGGLYVTQDTKITITALSAPALSAAILGVTWYPVPNATHYLVKVDGVQTEMTPETETDTLRVLLRTAIGTHTVSVRAVSNDPLYATSAEAIYTYATAEASLSDLARSGRTVSWQADGKVSLKVDGESASFNLSEGTYSCTCSDDDEDHVVSVTVKSVFSNDTYYYTKNAIVKETTVSINVLDTPALSADTDNGAPVIVWDAVDGADYYLVKTDDGEWSNNTERSLSLSATPGQHVVRVKAIPSSSDKDESSPALFIYYTKSVALSSLTTNGRTASWTATALTVTLSVNNDPTPISPSDAYSYTCPAEAGTYALSVTVSGGYDAKNAVYYVGEETPKSKTITVATLAAPTLSAGENGVSWNSVANATSYLVKVDDGEWESASSSVTAFRSEAGAHTVQVKASSDNACYLTSAEASYAYTTVAVELSEITVDGVNASWTATALKTYKKLDNAPYAETSDTSYTFTSINTHTLHVKAEGGFDGDKTYYAGAAVERSGSCTIRTLSAPTVYATDSGISWSTVSHATAYAYSTNGGKTWTNVNDPIDLSFAAESGSHTVQVRAIGNGTTYLTSSEDSYTYATTPISVGKISRSGRNISWTATAYSLTAKRGSTVLTYTKNGTSYSVADALLEGAGTYTFTVTASPAWDGQNKIYYYAASDVTESATYTVSQLSAPSINTPSAGATTISWTGVENATGYEYSTNSGTSWTAVDGTSVALSSSAGTKRIKVRAISTDSTKLTSSESSEFVYYSTPTTLSAVTFEGTRAKWVASARYVEVKEGSGSYKTTTLNYYDLTSLSAGSKTVTVKAHCGYDADKNIFYSGSDIERSGPKTIAHANTTITFEEQTKDDQYTVANGGTGAANWTQQYWNAGSESWITTSGQMNSRAADTGRLVNFSSSTTKERFTYSTGSSLGIANTFSVRIGNYHTSHDIWYKIALIDTDGNYHYLAGSTNKFVMFPSTGTNSSNKTYTTVSYTGFDPIEVSAIQFEIYGSTGSTTTYCYFYVDDVKLRYETPSLDANAAYSKGGFTVDSGKTTTQTLNTEGAANSMTFKLTNGSSSTAAYADVTLYNGNYMVATGRYMLAASTSNYTFQLLFNRWKVTKLTVSANNANITISDITFANSSDYVVADHDEYRVASASGDTSLLLMGEEVKSSTTINYTLTAIKQLQKYAADVSPLFASIVNVKQILSATYAQSIDVMSNSTSTSTYGKLTIKYIVNGSDTVTTSTITVKKKDSADLNDATRNTYSRNLWKEISLDPHEVILGGSSSMEKWERVGQDMKGITFADVGIGGTESTDWSKSGGLAERLIYPYNPRAVILFVGVNDLKGGKSVANTLNDVQALLTQIHNKLPNAKLYYVLINKVPLAISGSKQLTVDNVTSFNNSMKAYANSLNWLTTLALDTEWHMVYNGGSGYDFIYNDSTKKYDRASSYGKTSFFDSMHLNQAGYTEWAYAIRKKFLALDKKATWAVTD